MEYLQIAAVVLMFCGGFFVFGFFLLLYLAFIVEPKSKYDIT